MGCITHGGVTSDRTKHKLNMKRQFIITAPIDFGRYELEEACYTNSAFTQDEVTELMKTNIDFQLWDLIDFVEYCNAQEFDIESVWMQAITIDVPHDYNPHKSTWYLNLIRF